MNVHSAPVSNTVQGLSVRTFNLLSQRKPLFLVTARTRIHTFRRSSVTAWFFTQISPLGSCAYSRALAVVRRSSFIRKERKQSSLPVLTELRRIVGVIWVLIHRDLRSSLRSGTPLSIEHCSATSPWYPLVS